MGVRRRTEERSGDIGILSRRPPVSGDVNVGDITSGVPRPVPSSLASWPSALRECATTKFSVSPS
jgi:hypothetical protein